MYSRGSLDGDVLNGQELDGGPIVLDGTMQADVIVTGACAGTRRANGSGTATAVFTGLMTPTSRINGSGTAPVVVTGALNGKRRANGTGAAPIIVTGALNGKRRANGTGFATVVVNATLVGNFGHLSLAPDGRGMIVRQDRRGFFVAHQRRVMTPPAHASVVMTILGTLDPMSGVLDGDVLDGSMLNGRDYVPFTLSVGAHAMFVGAQRRTIAIPAEDRTIVVPDDHRELKGMVDNRGAG